MPSNRTARVIVRIFALLEEVQKWSQSRHTCFPIHR